MKHAYMLQEKNNDKDRAFFVNSWINIKLHARVAGIIVSSGKSSEKMEELCVTFHYPQVVNLILGFR